MYVKRIVAASGGVDGAPAADPKFSEKYPAMWEYLTLLVHEDGKPRKPSKLSLSFQEGRWCACFVDDDSHRLAFLSSITFADLLTSLEKRLSTGSMEWRASKPMARR